VDDQDGLSLTSVTARGLPLDASAVTGQDSPLLITYDAADKAGEVTLPVLTQCFRMYKLQQLNAKASLCCRILMPPAPVA
jgi:hypothetical protein